tara:strand:+ start:97 stop:816 length:720 start_codon:yes stop_codon:yes gene_type:complete
MKKKIIVTGGTGRFGNHLKNTVTKHNLFFPNKKEFNILNVSSMLKYFKKKKPDIVIHLAGLSRPMDLHEKDINKSINLNIIGTANVTMACSQKNIKLIYFSTNYVYPGINGNYNEEDPLKPFNNYAWSKLGGECSVMLYKNSLILRTCMTEKPFIHKKAFANVKTSFLYQDEAAKILFKLLNKKGVINIGGKAQNIYNFAKKENKNVKKIYQNKNLKIKIPFDSTISIKKLKKILKIKF